MKKLLFVLIVLLLFSCDSKMKKCSYTVYQHGKKLPEKYVKYIDLCKWCESFIQDGVIYKLDKVETVRVKDIELK